MVFFKKSLIKSETEPTERVRVTKIDEQLKFGGGKDERSLVKTQINTQRGISHIRRFIWYIYYHRILTYSYLNIMVIYIRVILKVWDLNDVDAMATISNVFWWLQQCFKDYIWASKHMVSTSVLDHLIRTRSVTVVLLR